MTSRVLVVEDHERWRRHLRAMLGPPTRWEVVGEASDGLEAIQKAGELNPDLILLDIGLPGLDGIQTARRLLADNPRPRILFVSEHQSLDVVQAALGTGVRGYIVKSDVARDLLIAMDAIVDGGRFISARFGGRVFDAANDVAVTREMRRHEAAIYSDEPSLLDGLVRFAAAALTSGSSLIILLPGSRRDALHQGLLARGIDVDGAIRERRYIPLEIPALLSRIVVDGRIDDTRFWDVASAAMSEAAQAARGTGPRVALCGECAPTLMRQGMWDAAITLERLVDDMARTFDVDVFCGYSIEDLRCDDENPVFQAMCAAHSVVHQRAR